ncbi:sugar transferase, partial [Campylobacter coli]|nr:sugar transferase [Campylobacter coli]
ELKVNKYDYISVPLSDLSTRVFKDIDDLEYRKYMQNIWKDIEFSESVKKIVNMAKQTCMKFKDFICIHIRSGDAIYDYAEFRKFNLQSIYHATPCEIAIGIIQKNKNKNIVLVGDDLLSIRQIAKFCNFKNVFVMEDFRNSNQLSNMELFFYDVIFMSYAKILYGTNSAVVRLANYIGNQKFINNYSVFNEKELYDIIKENIEKFNTSNSQKAFSYFHLFIVSKKINISKENLIEFLEKALEYDYENDKYRIHLIDVLLNHNEFSKANEMLKTILLTRESEYLKTLFLKGWIGVVYSNLFDIYLKSSCLQYPYIAYVAMHILKFRTSLQIQNLNN